MTGDTPVLPVSPASQWRAQSWSPEDFDVAEWVCRPHALDYSLEGGPARRCSSGPRSTGRPSRSSPTTGTSTRRSRNDDLDGRPPASSGERAPHVERLLDRRMGRRRARRDDDPPQGERTSAASGLMRSDQATVRTRWRRIGNYLQATVDHLRPRVPDRAVHPQHMMWVIRPGAADAAVSVRRGDGDRRAARQGAALPAGQESAARARIPSSPIGSARRTRRGSAAPRRCIPSTSRR